MDETRTAAWFIPRLIAGSGGHRTMLQHAAALERHGIQANIYIEGAGDDGKAAATIERLFGYKFENVKFGWDAVSPAHIAFATIWYSAAIVRDLTFPCHKIYFVQDYEAMFNPMGDAYLMAENSYRYGLTPITIGRWLKAELSERYKVDAFHYDFGADASIYKPLGKPREDAICFVYQPDKPRRCSRIGLEALGIVKHLRPEVKIYLYGSSNSDKGDVWFDHEHAGLLGLDSCNELYNLCSVGLCLSPSNPSRIPFEMMAAGLPVVELWRENNLYDLPEDAVSLSRPDPESIAEAIILLLDNAGLRKRMSFAGVQYMQGRSLLDETGAFVAAVAKIMAGERPSLSRNARLYKRGPVCAGEAVSELPSDIRRRIALPANSYLNSLPPFLRTGLAWGARKVRKMIRQY
jgi:glycosyltransferase involved in cell wall biosynthesis